MTKDDASNSLIPSPGPDSYRGTPAFSRRPATADASCNWATQIFIHG